MVNMSTRLNVHIAFFNSAMYISIKCIYVHSFVIALSRMNVLSGSQDYTRIPDMLEAHQCYQYRSVQAFNFKMLKIEISLI
jgi:hypothetical protein